MKRLDHRHPFVAAGLLFAILLARPGLSLARQREGPLDAAKARYGTAAYEDALAILDATKPAESDIALRTDIEKYRALCLLGLGRKADAERSFERLVVLQPSLTADALDASPWVRATFRAIRRRVLPAVVEQLYEQARTAVLQKSLKDAVGPLKQVLVLLDDGDLAASDERWRRDLRTLATGFLDLATAIPPSSPAVTPVVAVAPPAAPGDAAIVAAVPLIERMPDWPTDLNKFMGARETATGVIEVAIDDKGAVESAVMREPIHPIYDALLLTTARTTWRYRPATKGGVAVRDSRRIRVVIKLR